MWVAVSSAGSSSGQQRSGLAVSSVRQMVCQTRLACLPLAPGLPCAQARSIGHRRGRRRTGASSRRGWTRRAACCQILGASTGCPRMCRQVKPCPCPRQPEQHITRPHQSCGEEHRSQRRKRFGCRRGKGKKRGASERFRDERCHAGSHAHAGE